MVTAYTIQSNRISDLITSLLHTAKVFKTLCRQTIPYTEKVLQRLRRFNYKLTLLCSSVPSSYDRRSSFTLFLSFKTKTFKAIIVDFDNPDFILEKYNILSLFEVLHTRNFETEDVSSCDQSTAYDHDSIRNWPLFFFTEFGKRSKEFTELSVRRLCQIDYKDLKQMQLWKFMHRIHSVQLNPTCKESQKWQAGFEAFSEKEYKKNSIFQAPSEETYSYCGTTLKPHEKPKEMKPVAEHAERCNRENTKMTQLERYDREWNCRLNRCPKPISASKAKQLSLDGSMSCTLPVRLKFILILVLILLLFSSTYAKPLKINDNDTSVIYTYQPLSTPLCNPSNVNMTQSCQTNDFLLKLFLKNCKFRDLCNPGFEPLCVNIDNGMVFICAPEGLTCSKGFRWRTWIDKDDHAVKISVEECPGGTFQQHESGCFDACKSKHLDTKSIPKQYVVYFKGDNISPTYVYCNYEEGYYNMKGKFFLDYDQQSMHDPYFCGHIDEFDPCVEGQMPLPNGTCVLPCPQGECRDDYDDFICKPDCRDNGSEGHNAAETGVHKDLGGECQSEFDTCKNGECKRSFDSNVCQCFPGFRNDEETRRCIDVDECLENEGICKDDICKNKVGTYICQCDSGYTRDNITGVCIGYQGVAMSERRTTDQIEEGSELSANDISHQITKVKKKTNVTHTTTHIHTNGNVYFGNMNGLATQNMDFTQSCLGHPSNKTTDHQPQMDLEYPVNKECNTATVSSNSTSVKVLS